MKLNCASLNMEGREKEKQKRPFVIQKGGPVTTGRQAEGRGKTHSIYLQSLAGCFSPLLAVAKV